MVLLAMALAPVGVRGRAAVKKGMEELLGAKSESPDDIARALYLAGSTVAQRPLCEALQACGTAGGVVNRFAA
jgi:hypothetical protein